MKQRAMQKWREIVFNHELFNCARQDWRDWNGSQISIPSDWWGGLEMTDHSLMGVVRVTWPVFKFCPRS